MLRTRPKLPASKCMQGLHSHMHGQCDTVKPGQAAQHSAARGQIYVHSAAAAAAEAAARAAKKETLLATALSSLSAPCKPECTLLASSRAFATYCDCARLGQRHGTDGHPHLCHGLSQLASPCRTVCLTCLSQIERLHGAASCTYMSHVQLYMPQWTWVA